MSDSMVIVGGGLGACRFAEALRNNDFEAPITIISEEDYPPYDRPPLSKSFLSGNPKRAELKAEHFYGEHRIELRLGTRVVAVDPAAHRVTVERDGEQTTIDYGTLVLATGLYPRSFPAEGGDLAGVHVLRTYDDAIDLHDDIEGADHAVVIGAGFIGCEAAASMIQREIGVTLVEPAPYPLAGAVGPVIGKFVARLHTDAGVDLRDGIGVTRLLADDSGTRVSGVELTDGTVLPTDIVVVGIGSDPAIDYLEGSGIDVVAKADGGGIACDQHGRTSAPDVYAIGDVANWADAQGNPHRPEHWNHTVDQAVLVAAEITGHPHPAPAVPYFWSDQYDLKIQMVGAPHQDDTVHLVEDDGHKFLAYYSRDGLLTGVIGAGRAGKVMKARKLLQTETPISDVIGE